MYVIACELTFMANKIVDDTIYKIAVCLHICHRTFNSCLNTQTRKKNGRKLPQLIWRILKMTKEKKKKGKINGKYLNFYLAKRNNKNKKECRLKVI